MSCYWQCTDCLCRELREKGWRTECNLPSRLSPAAENFHRINTKLHTHVGAPAVAAAQLSSSVLMRGVGGTEMTLSASQEQSRSGTPAGANTPSLSLLCSVPASPSTSERQLQVRTRREIAVLGQDEHHVLGQQGRSHAYQDRRREGAKKTRQRRSSELELRHRQSPRSISKEGGDDTGVGELPEIQIRSQDECRGAGREGAVEEQLHQEAAHIEAQGGGEASEGRGEAEPAGSPVGVTGRGHPEDRTLDVPVPVLQLVPVLKTKQNSDCV